MAIAYVQQATSAAYGSSANKSISLTGVGAGNCLVVGVAGYTSSVNTVVDSTTGHGSLAFTQGIRSTLSGPWAEIWYQLSAYGGDTTVTITPFASAYLTLFMAEFSGVQTSSQPRATATGSTASTVSTLSTGSFSSTTVAGDLLMTVLSLSSNGGTLTWGETSLGNQLNAGSNESGVMGYSFGAGSDAARSASWTSAQSYPAIAALALKAAAASGGPFPWYFQQGLSGGLWDGGF